MSTCYQTMPRYSKSYKKNIAANLGQPNLLFDSLVKSDNTKHPTAAKSTGKLGKWGITSFTSLRHIRAPRDEHSLPFEDEFCPKKLKPDISSATPVVPPPKDQYIYNFESPVKTSEKTTSKRKFFKSRNNELDKAGKLPPERVNYDLSSNSLVNSEAKENTDFGRFVLKAKIDQKDGKKHYSIEPPKLKSSDNPIGIHLDYHGDDLSYDHCDLPYESDTALRTRMKLKRFFASPMSYSVQSDPSDNDSSNPESGLCDSKPSLYPYTNQSNDGSHVAGSTDNHDDFWESQESGLPPHNPLCEPNELRQSEDLVKLVDTKDLPQTADTNVQEIPQESDNLWNNLVNRSVRTLDSLDGRVNSNRSVCSEGSLIDSSEELFDGVQSGDNDKVENDFDSGIYTQNSDLADYLDNSESQGVSRNAGDPNPNFLQTSETSVNSKNKRIFHSRKDKTMKKATYRHKWHDEVDETLTEVNKRNSKMSVSKAEAFDFDEGPEKIVLSIAKVTVPASSDLSEWETVTKVKCSKESKKYYQVVKNVKKAHQIQESGEYQEFNDDVEYLLDSLQKENNIVTRCLSSVSLAAKCMAPAFRMHLRAHGTVIKFFNALHDAPLHPSLALCTSLVMFILSQDRLNIDLDPQSLDLMLQLLDSDASHTNSLEGSNDLDKTRQKVVELCAEMKNAGHAKQLNFDHITAGHLAMETLLSLTSKRAGEWFKEELRELGGLDHIVTTVKECMCYVCPNPEVWTVDSIDKLQKVDRCLRVLENVLHQNEENQIYLLKYDNSILLKLLMKLYNLCSRELPLNPITGVETRDYIGWSLAESLFTVLKVLINMTHDFDSQRLGSTVCGQHQYIFHLCLQSLFVTPEYLPEDKKFDLYVLALGLLINLVEHSQENRQLLLTTEVPERPDDISNASAASILEALVEMFFAKQESARIQEAKTDDILDGKKDEDEPEVEEGRKTVEDAEETIAKLLQKAGKHMEDTLVAAYISMLMGYLMLDSINTQEEIRILMPDHSYSSLLSVLKKLFSFMNLTVTDVSSSRGLKATEKVIKFIESLDQVNDGEPVLASTKETSFEDSICLDSSIDNDLSHFN